jgi:signal transduction histidine kinase
MLTVQDNGPGIDPEILPRIFEPFFTTKQNATSPGTGLGLSNVYNLAEAEGYGLCVESVLNQGTTMMVILPVAKLNSTSSTKEDAANPSPQGETVR